MRAKHKTWQINNYGVPIYVDVYQNDQMLGSHDHMLQVLYT